MLLLNNFSLIAVLSLQLLFVYIAKFRFTQEKIQCEKSEALHGAVPLSHGKRVCPAGNTCCVLRSVSNFAGGFPKGASLASSAGVMIGCIPNTNKGKGVCCADGETGCTHGYSCGTSDDDESTRGNAKICVAESPYDKDALLYTTPRYHMFPSDPIALRNLHGVIIDPEKPHFRLAYYSSHGDVMAGHYEMDTLQSFSNTFHHIQMVLIVIHGADLNADDYFYSGTVSAHMQQFYSEENVLIIAPWFASTSTIEGVGSLHASPPDVWTPLLWDDSQDRNGLWRYGAADSLAGIGSFEALDALIRCFTGEDGQHGPVHFPSLQRISVVGHSSGGQFVQRWALLSGVSAWERRLESIENGAPASLLRVVVSNPSSYCYLDGRRWINGLFQVPPDELSQPCPQYNQWPFGFDQENSSIHIPYRDLAIRKAGGVKKIAKRYAARDVIYLAGGQDRCNETSASDDKWCNSHGLETTCSDEMQGSHRLERSIRFYKSLQHFFSEGGNKARRHRIHRHLVVPGVGHDHSLIFQSESGVKSIFADDQQFLLSDDSRQVGYVDG